MTSCVLRTVRTVTFILALLIPMLGPAGVAAQQKSPPTFEDYGKWERLSFGGGRFGGGGGISDDGKWIVYGISREDGTSEQRLIPSGGGEATVVPYGSRPTFSPDGGWVALAIGHSEADQERMRRAQEPVQNKLGILDLRDRSLIEIEGIRSFAWSADGAWLAMQGYAPPAAPGNRQERGGRAGGTAPADGPPPGTTLIVRRMVDGIQMSFGNVADYAWQETEGSHLLAFIVRASGRSGNGVQLFDPATSVLRVLDTAAADYSGLAWREEMPDLLVMRSVPDTLHTEPNIHILYWTGVGSRTERLRHLDPATVAGLPEGMRVTDYRAPSWDTAGKTLFIGLAPWEVKPRPAGRGRGARGGDADSTDAVEPADVAVWHPDDIEVMAWQKLHAGTDGRRILLAAWHLESGGLTPIQRDLVNERVLVVPDRDYAIVEEWAAYAMDRSVGRPAADLYRADLKTGERRPLVSGILDRYVQVSPSGRYLLFLRDDHWFTIALGSGKVTDVTAGVATTFIDTASDVTVPQKPPFGTGGWNRDDSRLLLYDAYDIWSVAADGSGATRLTDGSSQKVRHRMVLLDREQEHVDLRAINYLSLFGERSKWSGYGILEPRGNGVTRLVWQEKRVSGLTRAAKAAVYAYEVQDYDDSPDIFVGGQDLKGARQVTRTNAFAADYAWGQSEVIDYTTPSGKSLQGALYYPAGFEAGRRYPMIVYIYETLSDNVHGYVGPSRTSYYNTSVYTTQGYFVLQPDIVFEPREPGLSVVDCVVPAVEAVVATGMVDGGHVGVMGHSWGGFDTTFLATHTDGVFAAAVAGAPITDLVSNYGNHHWSSGIAETDHIETGQQRMEVPLYDDLDAYIRNSAVFGVKDMTVPLLIEVGNADGTVFWHQGVELYNIARRARKNVVMIEYDGEDHGLRQEKNQVDYQNRILAWFGHYLKGQEAENWITGGQSWLDRQKELERLGGGGGGR